MTEEQFIKRHQETWKTLETLEQKMRRLSKKNGDSQVVKSFFTVYRDASHDLSYAKTHYPQSQMVKYLNQLVGRCHSLLYERKSITFKRVLQSLYRDFPEEFRVQWRLVLLAFMIFLGGAAMAAILTLITPSAAAFFLPQNLIDAIKEGQMGGGVWNYPLMSAYIMSNNILVSIKAFVYGILLGVGTIYVLFYNGAMLGALTVLVYQYADPLKFWSLILPHGIIELLAIFIAGGAGLMLAKGMFMPGSFKRWTAVVYQAKQAMPLLWGTIILLVIAGLIEGFITPLPIDIAWKYAVAALTFCAMVVLLVKPPRRLYHAKAPRHNT